MDEIQLKNSQGLLMIIKRSLIKLSVSNHLILIWSEILVLSQPFEFLLYSMNQCRLRWQRTFQNQWKTFTKIAFQRRNCTIMAYIIAEIKPVFTYRWHHSISTLIMKKTLSIIVFSLSFRILSFWEKGLIENFETEIISFWYLAFVLK